MAPKPAAIAGAMAHEAAIWETLNDHRTEVFTADTEYLRSFTPTPIDTDISSNANPNQSTYDRLGRGHRKAKFRGDEQEDA